MEDNEFTHWNGPGDSLGGLMEANADGEFTSLDSAYAEPEWAKQMRLARETLQEVATETPTKAVALPTEAVALPVEAAPTTPKQFEFSTSNPESIKEMITKFKHISGTKSEFDVFNPLRKTKLERIATLRIPIEDRVFGVFNSFSLEVNELKPIGLTNVRIQGALAKHVVSAKLACSMKIIDTVYDYSSWQVFRALFADDQTEFGRLPFSCMLGNNAVLHNGTSQNWQLLLQFDKEAQQQTFDRSDSYIVFDVVEWTESIDYVHPIVYTELRKSSDMFTSDCAGILVRGSELTEASFGDAGSNVSLKFEQKYVLGQWNWYPLGQSMLCNLPSDLLFQRLTKVSTNLDDTTGVVCVFVKCLKYSDEGLQIGGGF